MSEFIEYEMVDVKRPRLDKSCTYGRRYDRPRTKKKSEYSEDVFMDESRTVIIDSGAYSIKAEVASKNEPFHVPNCIMKAKAERKRLFIGNQIDECRDCSGLFYLLPCERGYITKWEVQKPIWDQVFNKTLCPVNEKNILMTQPLFNFKSIQDCIDEIFFEEYEISSMYRCNPTDLVALKYALDKGKKKETCVVIDSGYSFTHIVPYLNGNRCANAIKRLQIGGKMLTNHMKDILSYRQYHVMEETYVINQVKEDTCFVSENFKADLSIASESVPKNHIVRNYILPDFNTIRRGYISNPDRKIDMHDNCQVLRLNNERFAVPEILFTPSDIGISSVGLVDCLIDSIKLCPTSFQDALAKNIVVVGGNALLPGFRNRLIEELQSKMPAKWNVDVTVPNKSAIYAWQGGKSYLKQPGSYENFATKKEYDELGSSGIQRRFNVWKIFEEEETTKKVETKPISLIEHVNKLNIFKKHEEWVDLMDKSDQKEHPKSHVSDASVTSNKNILAQEEFNNAPPLNMFEDKNAVMTPPTSDKSSEISLSSDPVGKMKTSQDNCPQVKYFFEIEDSEDENPLHLELIE